MKADYVGFLGYMVPSRLLYASLFDMNRVSPVNITEVLSNNLLLKLSWKKVGHGDFRFEITPDNISAFNLDLLELGAELEESNMIFLKERLRANLLSAGCAIPIDDLLH